MAAFFYVVNMIVPLFFIVQFGLFAHFVTPREAKRAERATKNALRRSRAEAAAGLRSRFSRKRAKNPKSINPGNLIPAESSKITTPNRRQDRKIKTRWRKFNTNSTRKNIMSPNIKRNFRNTLLIVNITETTRPITVPKNKNRQNQTQTTLPR